MKIWLYYFNLYFKGMRMSYNWQEIEQGELCQKFADFVNEWRSSSTLITGEHCYTSRTEVFNMEANGIPFSFRKVGEKFSLLFNEKSEFIKPETYSFFKEVCQNFIARQRNIRKVSFSATIERH